MKRAASDLECATQRRDNARRALGAMRATYRLALTGRCGDVAELAHVVAALEAELASARAALEVVVEARRS